MSDPNIYEAPKSVLEDSNNFNDLNKKLHISLVKNQKYLLLGFLSYLFIAGSSGAFGAHIEVLSPFISIIVLLVYLATVFFIGRLSWMLYGKLARILMLVLGIVPFVNLLVMLAVNSRTNRILKEAGYKVGLLGANMKQFK